MPTHLSQTLLALKLGVLALAFRERVGHAFEEGLTRLVRPGLTGWYGLVGLGLVRPGLTEVGAAWSDLGWYGLAVQAGTGGPYQT